MRRFISAVIISGLCAAPVVFAQDSGTKTEAKKAGEATKDAGKDTADAAKHAGKATVRGTKKAATATKNAVQRTYACVDGTTDNATLKANACKDHGGVKVTAKAKS
jgi:Ni/Co efflux regulator RcnB